MIRHEERVELAGFQLLREPFDVGKVKVRIGVSARITPGAGMDADRPHEGA